MLCVICRELRDSAGGVIDNITGKFLVCAGCVERLTEQIDRLLPGRALPVLRSAIDCIAEKAVQALGLGSPAQSNARLVREEPNERR